MCYPTSLVLYETLLFKYLSLFVYIEGNLDCAKNIQQDDVMMTSDYAIVSINLRLEVGDDEYIIVCYFGDRRMSGFEVIEGASEGSPVA